MNSVEEQTILGEPELAAGLEAPLDQTLILEPGEEIASKAEEPELEIASALPGQVTVELDESSPVSLMEQLLNDPASLFRPLQYGQVLEGMVMYKDRDELLVDVGSKSEGIVPNRELQTLSAEEMQELRVGHTILVYVVQPQNEEGQAVLSIDKARLEKSWRKLQKEFEAGAVVEGEVYGVNKGGLLVSLEGVRGFVPSSQVSGLGAGSEEAKQNGMSRLVNSRIPLKVIEINRDRNRLILSERMASQEQREAQRERLMKELEAGQVREGTVMTICDFGAFVDIGGADGLVHLSEISWNRVSHPGQVLKTGERVKVQVLSIDDSHKKVALSIKRTQPEPWAAVTQTFQAGQVLEGTITQVTNFGAFVRIADGVEGLIHVSELAEGRVEHPGSVVKEGDKVTVRLLNIDQQRRRIGLSIRKATPEYDNDAVQEPEKVAAAV